MILSPLKKPSYKETDRQGPGWREGPQAQGHDGDLPGVDNERMLLQLIVQCVLPHHVGGCSCREPTPEIDNRLQEVGGNPAPATKTRTHTLLHHLRLTLKEKTQPTKRDLYKEPIFGTRLSGPQVGLYT